jgi:hypothetical protein
MSHNPFSSYPWILVRSAEFIFDAAAEMAVETHKAFRLMRRKSRGRTLRPGSDTPLLNALRRQLRPHLREYGDQVKLGRLLSLPRQRINSFVTSGKEMPDAERTLQLLAWLVAVRRDRRPS